MKNLKPKGQGRGVPPPAVMATKGGRPGNAMVDEAAKAGPGGPPLPKIHRGKTNLALFDKPAKPGKG